MKQYANLEDCLGQVFIGQIPNYSNLVLLVFSTDVSCLMYGDQGNGDGPYCYPLSHENWKDADFLSFGLEALEANGVMTKAEFLTLHSNTRAKRHKNAVAAEKEHLKRLLDRKSVV